MGRRGRFQAINGGRRWTKPNAYGAGPPRQNGWLRYSGLWLAAIFVGLAVGLGPSWLGQTSSRAGNIESLASASGVRAHFSFCHTGGGYNCVVDGDTIWLQGLKIRIADIDAPETHEYRCADEKALGDRATQRLLALVNSGEVSLSPIDRDEDRYGRKLRIVKVDGVSVGKTLVNDGLARWYRGGRRPWC
jgi:endonuclease YncB( thermonuclease family)